MYREASEVKTGLDMKQHRGRREEVRGQVAKTKTLFLFNKEILVIYFLKIDYTSNT